MLYFTETEINNNNFCFYKTLKIPVLPPVWVPGLDVHCLRHLHLNRYDSYL
jgi:hypothetical protein